MRGLLSRLTLFSWMPGHALRRVVTAVCGLSLIVTVLPAAAGATEASPIGAVETFDAVEAGESGGPGELESSEVTLAGNGAEPLAPASERATAAVPRDPAAGGATGAGADPSGSDSLRPDPGARSGEALEPTPEVAADQTPTADATRRTTAPAARGWSATVDIADGSEMVAFSWAGSRGAGDQGALLLRSHQGDGWSEWSELAANPSEGPDDGGNGTSGVGPAWLGSEGADRIEVVVSEGPLADLDLLAMRWNETDQVLSAAGRVSPAGPDGPSIRPRSDWAASYQDYDCAGGPRVMDDLRFAVVHHTATSNDYTRSQVAGILRGIYRYHVGTRGWCDVAYNFFIDRFGTVWQGRSGDISKPIGGGHAAGFNLYSVGVALLGDHRYVDVPASQERALTDLLAWKLNLHGIDPHGTTTEVAGHGSRFAYGEEVELDTIGGHRDTGQTTCPGYHAYRLLDEVREGVAAQTDAVDPDRWGPFDNPRQLAERQYQDLLGRAASEAEIAAATSAMVRDGVPPSRWIANLSGSLEADSVVAPVLRLYGAYFDRIPDAAGLDYWVGQRRDGLSISRISAFFAASGEFAATYGSLSDDDFVELVYANVLSRSPDQGGQDYWTAELSEGRRTRGSVMAGFAASAEYVTRTRLANRITLIWEGMLGRAPSEAMVNGWVSRIRGGEPLSSFAAMIYASPEYRARV